MEAAPVPAHYEESLSQFQRLVLLRCFRVDRIYRAITEYITSIMGEKYVTPPIITFETVFEQSSALFPIVFILSPGSDPASNLVKLAERSGFGTTRVKFLSLGQGQEKVTVSCFMIEFNMSLKHFLSCFCSNNLVQIVQN